MDRIEGISMIVNYQLKLKRTQLNAVGFNCDFNARSIVAVDDVADELIQRWREHSPVNLVQAPRFPE